MAPFTYVQGKHLATYVEFNVDEMNNLKPLELPDDSEDEAPAEEPVESKNGEIAEKDEDEPEIKSEKDDCQIEEKPAPVNSLQAMTGGDEENELENMAQDIFENFALTKQIIGDFVSNDKTRQDLMPLLLIDVTLREAEFAKFY